MSDLGGGRNGGVRAGGPVPVGGSGTPDRGVGIRTPRDVMRDRTAREARRQEEQKAEEARRVAEERRRSAERRAEAVTGRSSSQRASSGGYAQQPQGYDGAGDRRSQAGAVSGAEVLGEPVSRTQEYPSSSSRARGPSISREEYARAQQPAAAGAGVRRTQQSQAQPRQPSAAASSSTTAGPSQPRAQPLQPSDAAAGERATASSFPHAFERWENLSSHWEGLTSYWLHKLEQNTEEIRATVPNASTLNRQITDLSAAGANLFHAVVELQRLRASSERKFQRWFFETRSNDERAAENLANVDRQLKLEKSAREEAALKRAQAEQDAELARREATEAKRELQIAKEEAHRAWDELGHRNQEALELAENLKSGRVAVVGGVQVVPYFGGPSRSGTGASNRPTTREGMAQAQAAQQQMQQQQQQQQYAPAPGAQGYPTPGDDEAESEVDEEEAYYRMQEERAVGPEVARRRRREYAEEDRRRAAAGLPSQEEERLAKAEEEYQRRQRAEASPTNTDPFTEDRTGGQAPAPLSSSLAAGTYAPPATTAGPSGRTPVSAQEAQRFYQLPPAQTFLHSPPGSTSSQPGASRTPQAGTQRREEIRSEPSYADTMSEGDTEYAIDAAGNIQHDEQGRPIVFSRRGQAAQQQPQRIRSAEEESDPGYEEAAAAHERELAARYGASASQYTQGGEMPEAPTVPSTAAQAMATYAPTSGGASLGDSTLAGSSSGRPDYEGSGYGGWENVQTTRHHHPTRLSDVLEEEEERSSRRTGTGD